MGHWIIESGASIPRGLVLVCEERVEAAWNQPDVYAAVAFLNVAEVVASFGEADPSHAALSWHWRDANGRDVEDTALGSAALVHVGHGARVPLADVPRLMGHAVTREGARALSFVVEARGEGETTALASPPPTTPLASPLAALIDAPEAAAILGITEAAFRSRLQRGDIPERCIKRTGSGKRPRLQFVRAKLEAWANEGGRAR